MPRHLLTWAGGESRSILGDGMEEDSYVGAAEYDREQLLAAAKAIMVRAPPFRANTASHDPCAPQEGGDDQLAALQHVRKTLALHDDAPIEVGCPPRLPLPPQGARMQS